jgi:Integral membrane protein (PIN domain superfamily)
VAKRHDLIKAAESIGILRRGPIEGEAAIPHILVDTSAIIDGRIADIADSGFLFGILEVPRFVLDEVQRLADSSDGMRRTRGRRGLEILARMRKTGATPVVVIDEDVPGTPEVDSKLVALAKRNGRAVLTNDLNLNRIADLQGVRVLNVNSLANAVKPALLPGEDLRLRVIQPGKDAGQGVGYLDDGTMVVVEGGAKAIDTEVDVTVTRVLQTVAGRMVFAHPRQG